MSQLYTFTKYLAHFTQCNYKRDIKENIISKFIVFTKGKKKTPCTKRGLCITERA